MIVKNYRERGKNNKELGRRGLTLTRIILVTTRILEGRIQKEKQMVRTGQQQGKIGHCYCSALAGISHYKEDIKWRCAILTIVSLYIEWETFSLSLLKRDAPLVTHVSLYLCNRRHTIGMCISHLSYMWVHLEYEIN
jgi:hypothetical protein